MEVALVLPAVLLAVGWFVASWREQNALIEQDLHELQSRTDLVAAAVSEGLEELRSREDIRPHYHWAYYFTPEDIIAVQDAVAVSPLGRLSQDQRVFGHFQIDPGPTITSPLLHPEASDQARRRGAEVINLVKDATEQALLNFMGNATPVVRPTLPRGKRQDAKRRRAGSPVQETGELLNEIRAAQAGSRIARELLSMRGRLPPTSRVTVPLDMQSHADTPAPDDANATPQAEAPAPAALDVVRYTPMAYLRVGENTLVYRVVTVDGVASIQGALLDPAVIRGRWLKDVAQRHAVEGTPISFMATTRAGTACVAATALAYPLDNLSACATELVHQAGQPLFWQVPALLVVLTLIGLSAASRRRALTRAENLARTERAFVASVSHELRTPLTTLRMHAEMLAEGWVTPERRERVVQQLVEESSRLARLIDDVLTFGRLSEDRANLRLQDVDIAQKVTGILERERARLEERGVVLNLTGVPEEAMAKVDVAALEQVVMNLVDNAAKYAASAADRSVDISIERRGKWQVFRVADHGAGIPVSEREKVFERFYRGRDAVASHVAGTGLGLPIVRGLTRAMGGDTVVANNTPGTSGCVMEVRLPAA